ncbi:uncharacterized protein LOC141602090 [Silene latifolia]|uniref:uncharacterized protein LOC141602090 n=1 Tax=Silene latifolia TaxID=37657 RepID=UPI003D789E57
MVYAFNGLHERKVLWSKLSQFKEHIQGAWAICGDFNTVLSPNKRLGGSSSEEEIIDFKNCIDDCDVMDCPATGSLFTWCNKHEPATMVYSRLDRVLVNQRWLQDYPQAYAHFYCEGIFYHCPCVVQSKLVGGKKKRSFKYFNMWSKSVDFQQCVKTIWDQDWPGTKMYKLVCKLKHLKGPLKNLNKNDFDDVEINFARAQMYLEKVQKSLRTDPLNPDLIVQEREAASSVRFLNDASYEVLLQKSKAVWVEKGDCNTKYFHSIIKGRQNAFLAFYTNLLGSSTEPISVAKNVVQMGKICTDDHHATLLAPVTNAEIKHVLATILPSIISDNQGGFIKGRSIVENIIICQDIVRCYNRKSISPRFMLKVDLKKAYDSINWEFMKQMLTFLNFPLKFIDLVMECITTASYSVVLNGEVFGHFKGAKGLRQGDPLSPLLYTIAMEYLSRILKHTTSTMPFKFHLMCSQLKLSHLMFVDDLLLFCKGDVNSIMILLRSFATFSCASGLQMNSTKPNAYFNGVHSWVKHDILQVSGFKEGHLPFTYLGIPITCGRMKKTDCNILVENETETIFGMGGADFVRVSMVGWEKVYLKGQAWKDYKPSGDLSWGWKSVCKVKDKLDTGYQNGHWLLGARGYTLRSGYDLIRHKFQNVPWHKQIWNFWSLPKHQFIGWLIAREALMLKDKLFSLGIAPDDDCLLCGKGRESHTHLFQTCEYSRRLLDEVSKVLRITLPVSNPLRRIADGQFSQVQKGVILSAISATFYHIWLQRNKARVDGVIQRPEILRDLIQKEIKTRIAVHLSQGIANSDNVWLRSRSLIV